MNFEKEKEKALSEYNRALSHGLIDKKIEKILILINNTPDYYTTSSCSGRISLDIEGKNKREHLWLFKTHSTLDFEKFIKYLRFSIKLKPKNLFLKVDSFIIHVVCRNLESAEKLLKLAHSVNLKRSGIIQLDKKIIVEIMGLDRLEFPLILNGCLLIKEEHLKEVVNLANMKLLRNFERLEFFYQKLSKTL